MGGIYNALLTALLMGSDNESSGTAGENQIVFSSKLSFPEIGETKKLYIATDECEVYIWNEQSQKYETIGSNAEIDVIQATL